MKDYADASSWTKIISLAAEGFIEGIPRSHCRHKAIGFRKSGEVILEMYGGYLVSHVLETQEIKDLRIRGCGLGYTFVDSYVESLVLLDKPNQGKDRKERGTTRENRIVDQCYIRSTVSFGDAKHRIALGTNTPYSGKAATLEVGIHKAFSGTAFILFLRNGVA